MKETSLTAPRHWVEFQDPEEPNQIYRIDLTWLTSKWNCIYGRGCKGIEKGRPNDGCCTHGAHFSEKADYRNVKKWVAKLTDNDWQFRSIGLKKGWTEKEDGADKTKVVDGACIFLSRPGFSGGDGCAFHKLASRIDEQPADLKPEVCWQLPIRRDYERRKFEDKSEQLVVLITEYDRRSWGEGGVELNWYCSSNPEAHTAAEPVYITERYTLIKLMNEKAYQLLVQHCKAHEQAIQQVTDSKGRKLIPLHPATAVWDRK